MVPTGNDCLDASKLYLFKCNSGGKLIKYVHWNEIQGDYNMLPRYRTPFQKQVAI